MTALSAKFKVVAGLVTLTLCAVLLSMFLQLVANSVGSPGRELSPEGKGLAAIVSTAIALCAVLYALRCVWLLRNPAIAGQLTRVSDGPSGLYQLEASGLPQGVLQVRLWQLGRDHGDLNVLTWTNRDAGWGVLAGRHCVWLPRPAITWSVN